MDSVRKLLRRLSRDESGQDFAEYGIAFAVVGTVAALVALAIHTDVSKLWTNAQSVIHGAL